LQKSVFKKKSRTIWEVRLTRPGPNKGKKIQKKANITRAAPMLSGCASGEPNIDERSKKKARGGAKAECAIVSVW